MQYHTWVDSPFTLPLTLTYSHWLLQPKAVRQGHFFVTKRTGCLHSRRPVGPGKSVYGSSLEYGHDTTVDNSSDTRSGHRYRRKRCVSRVSLCQRHLKVSGTLNTHQHYAPALFFFCAVAILPELFSRTPKVSGTPGVTDGDTISKCPGPPRASTNSSRSVHTEGSRQTRLQRVSGSVDRSLRTAGSLSPDIANEKSAITFLTAGTITNYILPSA